MKRRPRCERGIGAFSAGTIYNIPKLCSLLPCLRTTHPLQVCFDPWYWYVPATCNGSSRDFFTPDKSCKYRVMHIRFTRRSGGEGGTRSGREATEACVRVRVERERRRVRYLTRVLELAPPWLAAKVRPTGSASWGPMLFQRKTRRPTGRIRRFCCGRKRYVHST